MSTDTSSKGIILVVDDEWANREMLRAYLKRAGYEVHEASSGEQALAQVAQTPPNLIMLDVNMPVMDGYETCRRLKQNEATRNIPVLVVTALEDTAGGAQAQAAGADGVVRKPFDVRALLETIEGLLAVK